ncbi:MAG: ChaN family lipoprotein [Candidatus Aminicenantes bacterium]|nr:ChaN family lipoprotein [Candidatus Aminicenantes bacterium]
MAYIVFPAVGQDAGVKSLQLKIGDPRFKDKVLDVAPEALYAMETGTIIPFAKMIQEMKGGQLVYIGETHNSLPMHDIQFKILQALYEQDRNISIGLEMFPVTFQDVLNKWSLGILSEEEFIREGQWYVNWNFNFGFYKKIFDLAKANKIPMVGLNAPRELQTTWDFVMGYNAVKALKKEQKKMIVLAGSGHLIYNLGINLRAYEKSRLPGKTVISVFVPKGQKNVRISRSLGDYILGIPEEEKPAYPSVGLSFKKFKGLENLVIDSKPIDGAAKAADFEKGDVVLVVDGRPWADVNELRTYLAKFKWEEETKFRILRNGQEKDVILKFQEQPAVPAEPKKEEAARWPK